MTRTFIVSTASVVRAIAVLLFVQRRKALTQRRRGIAAAQRQRQLRIRAGVAQVHQPFEAMRARREALLRQRGAAFGFKRPVHGIQAVDIEAVEALFHGSNVVVLHLGEEHAERTEQARHRRHQDSS